MKRPDPPSLRETLRGLREQLEAAGVASPSVEAERLLAHALDVDRARLAVDASRPLPTGAAATLARLVARRAAGEPLQHIEGTVAFRGLLLRADSRALVPRPETEQLVDLAARLLRRDARASGGGTGRSDGVRTVVRPPDASTVAAASPGRPSPRPHAAQTALDVGTGSGAIALALVAEGLAGRAVGLDVSEPALEQARENRQRAGLAPADVELRLAPADPFDVLRADESFDLLVSNPPYVRDGEMDDLPPEVRDHEPATALAGGADGLDLVRTIAARAPRHLAQGARLILEIGADQGPAATAVFEGDPGWTGVELYPDLSGRDRFVTARRR